MYSVLHAVAIFTGKEISIIVRGGCDCASCETQIFAVLFVLCGIFFFSFSFLFFFFVVVYSIMAADSLLDSSQTSAMGVCLFCKNSQSPKVSGNNCFQQSTIGKVKLSFGHIQIFVCAPYFFVSIFDRNQRS